MGLRLGETFNRAAKKAEKKRAAGFPHQGPILVIAGPKKAKPSKKKGKK